MQSFEILGDKQLEAIFRDFTGAQKRGVYITALKAAGLVLSKKAKETFKQNYKATGKHIKRTSIKRSKKTGKVRLNTTTSVQQFQKLIRSTPAKQNGNLVVNVGALKTGLGHLFHLFEKGTVSRSYMPKNGKKPHLTGKMPATHFWEKANILARPGMNSALVNGFKKEFQKIARQRGAI